MGAVDAAIAACLVISLLAVVIAAVAPHVRTELRLRRERNGLYRLAGFSPASKAVDDLIAEHGQDAEVTGPVQDALIAARNDALTQLASSPLARQNAYFDAAAVSFLELSRAVDRGPHDSPPRLRDVRRRLDEAESAITPARSTRRPRNTDPGELA